jgi:ABC-type Mn2+/Zn2+ transport system ATPase subunit
MGNNAVIEVRDLVKVYGDRTVLKGINFQVYENEVFGLLGENGAGKTTTLEIIEGLRKLYGADAKKPGTYAANCLLARRLAERPGAGQRGGPAQVVGNHGMPDIVHCLND